MSGIQTQTRAGARAEKRRLREMEALGPTRERLLRAGALAVVESADDGEARSSTPGAAGARLLRRVVFRDTTPLDRYRATGRITDRQWQAGDWLARVYRRMCLTGQLRAVDFSAFVIRSQGIGTPVHDARRAFTRAMERSGLLVPGDGGGVRLTPRGRVVRDVCGLEEPARGSKMVTLSLGLDALADYLGLPAEKRV